MSRDLNRSGSYYRRAHLDRCCCRTRRRSAPDPQSRSNPRRPCHRTLDAQLGEIIAAHPTLAIDRQVVEDTPLRALLVRAGGARLLVVGHRGRQAASGMLLGSTSQALVKFAPCPIALPDRRDQTGRGR